MGAGGQSPRSLPRPDAGPAPAGFSPFPRKEIEQSIPDRFGRIVRAHGNRIAVKTGARALTYTELDAAANRIAHEVLARRGEGPEAVALLFEPGAEFLAALLGVLKTGKLYAPLDPGQPAARLRDLLADLGAGLVLADAASLAVARAVAGDDAAVLGVDLAPVAAPASDPGIAIAPDALAYVIFTSGSTGGPKGVMIDHREVLHYTMTYTNSVHYAPEDRVSALNALTTNAVASDIFPALLNGAAVLPYSIKASGVDALPAWLAAEGVTCYCSIPAIFRAWASRLEGDRGHPALRLVRLGGDQMLRGDVELFQRHFAPGAILRNGLGSAEVLVVRHCFIDRSVAIASPAVPVGYAVEDKDVLIVDDERQPVPAGEVGEIAVRSRYMARGYWRRPEQTAERFLDVPGSPGERVYLSGDLGRIGPDGCLAHLGRKDFQVKVRGKLIAPIEVENALLDMPSVREAAVVARADSAGDLALVAYVVPAEAPGPSDGALRRALAASLPSEMIPAAFARLESLPLLGNGKVDRLALPAPPPVRSVLDTPFVAPRNPLEDLVARIWVELLQIDRVGVHDNFLEIGGNSLLATKIASVLASQLDMEVPVAAALNFPTVERLARAIVERSFAFTPTAP